MANALAVVERIYATIGLDLSASVRDKMERYVAGHGRDKRPAHGYTLAQFGLDAEAIRREFSAYRETYVLPHQQ